MEQISDVRTSSVLIPNHKVAKIKELWLKIYTPVVQLGKLQIRFNHKSNNIELRTCETTVDIGFLERSVTYIQAIVDGFKPEDAISIIKFRDVFTESFYIQDVRILRGSHLNRIKDSIEHFSRCKFILQDEKISLLGCESNIKIAKDAIGKLIRGSEPTSIFNKLRIISSKIKDKYRSIETIYEDLRK